MNTPCNVNGTSTILTCTTGKRGVTQSKVREKLKTTKAITLAFLFAVITILSIDNALAQNNNATTSIEQTPAKEGTYQFIFRLPGSEQNIQLTALQLTAIERLRKDTEPVYAASSSNDYIKIKILPRNADASSTKFIFKSEMAYEELQSIRYVEIP